MTAAILAAFSAAAPPQRALAGHFTVTACGDAPSNANNAWVPHVTNDATLGVTSACGTGGDYGGLTVPEDTGVGGNARLGDEAFWTLTTAESTRVTAFSVKRWGHVLFDEDWRPEIRADNIRLENFTVAVMTDECSFGASGGNSRSTFSELAAEVLRVGGRCVPSG